MSPFFIEVAQYNLKTSNLELRLQVFGGALFSTIDLVTTIYMTVQFLNTTGQEYFRRINAALIYLTMFFQLLLAYTQNSKKLSLLAQDTFCILVGFKPALDAHRVGPGAEKEDHQVMPPLQEATVGKGVETVFEVIPSSVVQIFAILLAKERKVDASISTLVSATTIGFTSSMLSYDWDTSPTSR